MRLPQQTKPSQDREAKAPYNFVPLPEHVLWAEALPTHDVYHPDRHTGWLDCILTTASPLYVRCGLLPAQVAQNIEAKDLPDFFYTDPTTMEPVIPGSSLRGMLRAMVEIVSYSKVQPVTEQPLIYRAVADTSSLGQGYRERLLREVAPRTYEFCMKAGYMHRRGSDWEIVPAQLLNGANFARVEQDLIHGLPRWQAVRNAFRAYVALDPLQEHQHNRGKVRLRYVKATRIAAQNAPGLQEAVIVRTGRMSRKHMEFVFGLPDKSRPAIKIKDELIESYKEQITDEQKKLLGKDGVLQDDQPVFYLVENGKLVFFGHAMMFRLPYLNAPLDFVPQDLRDFNQTDLAEAIFGYIEGAKNAAREVARRGRIAVTDAALEAGQGNIWLDPAQPVIIPKILASPKPTTFQHYLVQESDDKRSLAHYGSRPGEETVIRGHKLYWHKDDVDRAFIEAEDFRGQSALPDGDKQHTAIKPVRSGVRFGFRIHFENLSDVELGALLWLLALAADDAYCFKLGMGKPFGLGSVKIKSDLHLTDRQVRYAQLFADGDWVSGDQETDAVRQTAVSAFEQRILRDPVLNPERAKSLREVSRIKMLLFLLAWLGPDKDKTRYQEIEYGPSKENEYKDRPVLPLPSGVANGPMDVAAGSIGMAPPRQTVSGVAESPVDAATARPPSSPISKPAPAASTVPRTVSHPTSADEIQEGDLLEGRVVAVESNRVVLDLGLEQCQGTLSFAQLDSLVQKDRRFELYRLAQPVRILTAQSLAEQGDLAVALVGTLIQGTVDKIVKRHGKVQIKLGFFAWLSEKTSVS